MKFLVFVSLLCARSLQDENYDDRANNAVDVANAGMAACRNPNINGPQRNTVPYLTSNSYMINAFGVIGGVLKYYHNRQMQKQLKNSFMELNQRFDDLENDINSEFAQLMAYVDRKQFQSDITDPTSILWGEMLAYVQYPNNETHANMQFECARQTPWQIAVKLSNRLSGPDNSIMTQIQSDKWSNSSFMATKDVVMTKIFQLMTVEAFCVGVQHGDSMNATEDWSIQRMYKIYSNIVNQFAASRIAQERDYFEAVVPPLVVSTVTDKSTKNYDFYANQIYETLSQTYGWDRFGVVISTANCDHLGENRVIPNDGKGYSPYASIQVTHNGIDVFVIRYWIGQNATFDRSSSYSTCMQSAFNTDPIKWADYVNCGQFYNILANNWYCGGDVKFAPSRTKLPEAYYFVSDVIYKDGYSSAVWPSMTRKTSVEYDLGFWERTINVSLMPLSN